MGNLKTRESNSEDVIIRDKEEGGGGIKFTDNEIVSKEEIDVMISGNIKQIETMTATINIEDL